MKKTTKITTILILTLALCIGSSVSTFAAAIENESVQPLWNSISAVSHDMSFLEGNGNASGVAKKQTTATSISATLTVYKKVGSSYVYIDSVSGTKTIGSLGLSIDFPCTSGTTYKSVLTVTAYTGSTPETETFEVIKTCP